MHVRVRAQKRARFFCTVDLVINALELESYVLS